jgi:putative transposase
VSAFIDQHRDRFGVEPICKALQVAPSGYRRLAARRRNAALCPLRQQRDAALLPEVERVWTSNLRVYGADKVWKQLHREGRPVARCTVERLMRLKGWRGVARGKTVRTTVAGTKAACPLDRVNREFKAERPNQLWVADFTYVPTWQGFVCVAFVIDVYARYIVGWRVSSSMRTDFVLDALEQALYARRGQRDGELIHHSDQRAVQGRVDSSTWALEDTRSCRAGHARVGLVVQPPPTARAHRLHPAGRGRGKLLATKVPGQRFIR